MSEARIINEAVVVFIRNNGDYLLLQRDAKQQIDPGVLNGVGGRVKPGESYLDAVRRKVEDETGYVVKNEDIVFVGLAREEGCDSGDWTMAYFVIDVDDANPPAGMDSKQGRLEWESEQSVLTKGVVADLQYLFPEIVRGNGVFFAYWQRKNSQSEITNFTLAQTPSRN